MKLTVQSLYKKCLVRDNQIELETAHSCGHKPGRVLPFYQVAFPNFPRPQIVVVGQSSDAEISVLFGTRKEAVVLRIQRAWPEYVSIVIKPALTATLSENDLRPLGG